VQRVLHIIWRLSRTGGIPVAVRALAAGIDPEATRMDVLTIRRIFEEDGLEELPHHVRVESLGLDGAPSRWHRLALIRAVRARVIKNPPSLLHLHSGTAQYAVAVPRSVPILLEMHDAPRMLTHVTQRMTRRVGRAKNARVITNSEHVRADTIRDYDLDPESVDVVPLGLEPDWFEPHLEAGRRVRDELGIEREHPVVLWVGRVSSGKRPQLAIDAARSVEASGTRVTLVMVGSGSQLAELRRHGPADDPTIRILGSRPDLLALYAAADVFLSTSAYEGFGLSIAQAMAMGLPTVATRGGAVSELVRDGVTGFVTSDDVDSIGGALTRLLVSPDARVEMGRAARGAAEGQLRLETMTRAYERVYEETARTT
jgi:glycosyltransferase involved in cell wall biosynthesis